MKLEGLILDKSDIQTKQKTNFNTGEVNDVGLIKLITTYPTQTVDVHVSVELMKDPKTLQVLNGVVGTRTQLSVEYKEMSFANSDGKHVAINGFHLFELPHVKAS
ncbi:Conserved hypothetical protein [Phage Swp3]|uniref:Uncharacterized protein n=1 Tax=Shewanella piezotolerans (strain WP3 / JCM 13877) TaxID=225849 RepID=B8CP58_SHEPW|nr:hypothetical protein [Shewanella piezotolerans]ACJ29302.1 Conserved hypothetical protein [Shewanella piezotolerans WP3]AKM49064.1 FpsB [Expression vector SW2]